MVLHGAVAFLRLEQSAAPPAPPAPDFEAGKPPTHQDVARNVQSGAIARHSSRNTETMDEHRIRVNYIQRSLGLPVGLHQGGWNM